VAYDHSPVLRATRVLDLGRILLHVVPFAPCPPSHLWLPVSVKSPLSTSHSLQAFHLYPGFVSSPEARKSAQSQMGIRRAFVKVVGPHTGPNWGWASMKE